MTISEPCVVYDMPEADYHADPCPEPSLSSTMAKTIIKPGGPALLRWQMTHPRVEKRAFDFGHAAHEKILGRGMGVVEIPAEYLTSSGAVSSKAEAKAWLSAQRDAGLVPLKAEEIAQIGDMAEALLANPLAAELLTQGSGQPEVSMFSVDDTTGQWMRGRLDFLANQQLIVDYKTSGVPVDADSWTRQSWAYGYHIQAAHYLRMGVQLGCLDPDSEFVFVAQSKTAPYLVSVFRLDDEALQLGYRLVDRALTVWDRCLTTGEWPGMPQTIQTITVPKWAHLYDNEEF